MIAGETEFLLTRDPKDDSYESFLGFGEKGRERRLQRREQRRAEGRKPGQGIMDLLSSPGLGNTINNLSALLGKKGNDAPSDYQVTVGGDGDYGDDNKGKDNTMLIVGGVVLAGLLVLGYTQMKKKPPIQRTL